MHTEKEESKYSDMEVVMKAPLFKKEVDVICEVDEGYDDGCCICDGAPMSGCGQKTYSISFVDKSTLEDEEIVGGGITISLCERCYKAMVKTITRHAAENKIVGRYDWATGAEVAKWNGLKDKQIDCKTATVEELHSDEWCKRKEAVVMFKVCRSNLDRYRRKGQIEARRIPSTNTQKAGYNDYPQAGYIYRKSELAKIFGYREEYLKKFKTIVDI